jgi:NitT/TauT family transport system permease protein
LLLMALWEASARWGWVDRAFFPPFSEVCATIARMALDGSLYSNVLVSAFRGVLGFVWAIIIGLPVGAMLAYRAPDVYAVIEPFLRVLSQVNPFSLMPLFLLFFGTGETVKIAAVAWVALWPIVFYAVTAIQSVDPMLVKAARAMAAPGAALLFRVMLPAAVPCLFVGVRIGSGLVFFMLVGAEMLGTTGGLGWLVHNSAMNYQIHGIYAGAVLVIALGYGLHSVLAAVEARLHVREDSRAGVVSSPSRAVQPSPLRVSHMLAMGAALFALVLLGAIEVLRLQAQDRLGTARAGHATPSTAGRW